MLGLATPDAGPPCNVDKTFVTGSSVLYDAIVIGGNVATKIASNGNAIHWVLEAFKHCKTIAAWGDGVTLFERLGDISTDPAVITDTTVTDDFLNRLTLAIAKHRNWERDVDAIPA